MSDTDTGGRLRALLARVLDLPPASIGPESSSATHASWTSLNHLMLISEIEATFGVAFSNQQVRDLTSYEKLLSAITVQLTTSN